MAGKRLPRRIQERLLQIASHLQCAQHGTPLVCAWCDCPGRVTDLPEEDQRALDRLLTVLGLTAREPRLAGPMCRRCGTALMCPRCNAPSGRALAAYDNLPVAEQAAAARLVRHVIGAQSWWLDSP
jgi:hypothetical protein